MLREEVRRVEEYARRLKDDLASRSTELEAQWRTIESWKASRFPDVDEQIAAAKERTAELAKDVERLLKFVALNVTGAPSAA